jgi:hypothetical protein
VTRIQREIDGRLICADVNPDQESIVRTVFFKLQEIARRDPLRAGMRIRFGWTLFTLEADGDALVVCEPDFDGDPLTATRPSIATSLDVIAKQAAFARAQGVVPVDVTFDQIIVARRGAITSTNVQAFRDDPNPPDDSGWSISVAGTSEASENPDDYEPIPTYRLLCLRPALLPALVLPPGYGVFLEEDQISQVLSPPEV